MNRQELYEWLDNQNPDTKKDTAFSSVYYLVTYYDDITEHPITAPLHFMQYENSYFESPCSLTYQEINTEEDLKKYVQDLYISSSWEDGLAYEKNLWRDGKLYEIYNLQVAPFIEEVIDIKMISERECLEWMLSHDERDVIENLELVDTREKRIKELLEELEQTEEGRLIAKGYKDFCLNKNDKN